MIIRNPIIQIGLILLGLYAVIALFSPNVAYDRLPELVPILIFVGLYAVAGIAMIVLLRALKTSQNSMAPTPATLVASMIAVGLFARLIMLGSTPILEDDWLRYLWEGGLNTQGLNPAAISPAQVVGLECTGPNSAPPTDDIKRAAQFSFEHGEFAAQVAYPCLTTIYPRGAQTAFQIAHYMHPFSLSAWRLLLILVDLGALFLMVKSLSIFRLSPLWASLYWWNPIIILEGHNSAHMDILLAPIFAGLVLAVFTQRKLLAAISLGLAVSIKIWPILLTPLIVPTLWRRKISLSFLKENSKSLAIFSAVISAISAYALFPLAYQMINADSGLSAYATTWQKNSFLFPLILEALYYVTQEAETLARLSVASIIIGLTLFLALIANTPKQLPRYSAVIIAALILLAPAGYPWYAIWFLIFLPYASFIGKPAIGYLFLCTMMPLYYLRFPLAITDQTPLFNNYIAPLEFGLPILVLIICFFTERNQHEGA